MKILISWLIAALAILVAAYILPGVVVESFVTALVLAVVMGGINMFVRPVILVLTLPINILSLGLFTLVINGALILLASSIVPGFHVDGFWWALLFSFVLAIVRAVLGKK